MIEDDLFRRLKKKAAEQGWTLQRLLNDLLRRALAAPVPRSFKLKLEGWQAAEQAGVDLLDRDKLFDLMNGR